MPFQLSPGVNVSEIDLTTVIPAVATTDAAIGGVFRWGPVDKTMLVDSEDALAARFGKPSNVNAETWMTAASYLAYSNKLHVSRAHKSTGNTVTLSSTTQSNTEVVITGNNASGIVAGDAVLGSGIPVGTVVSSVTVGSPTASDTTIELNKAASAGATVNLQYFDANYSFNAIANTNEASLAGQIVKNDDHYDTKDGTFDTDVQFVAKYPGDLGNSLKISVCDSNTAFQSTIDLSSVTGDDTSAETITFAIGSNTATVSISNTAGTTATESLAAVTAFAADVQVGDLIKVGNSSIGTEFLKITSLGTPVSVDDGGLTGESTVTVSFDQRYSLREAFVSTTVDRNWEYSQVVELAPEQSAHQLLNGSNVNDEIHVVVADEDGKISGVPGTILEVFQAMSRATDSKKEDGSTNHYKEIVNSSSKYVWYANDISGAASAAALDLVASTNILPYSQSFVEGRDVGTESTAPVGLILEAYDQFRSAEDIDISLVLAGKARGGTHGEQIANYLVDNIAESRRDCVVFVSPEKADVVNNAQADEEADVVQFRNACRSTSYGVLDSGYKYMYDKYNDIYRWIPLNGDTAGLAAFTDQSRDPWYSPAGFNRGQIKNVIKLAWNPKKAERDVLYKNGVNPVVNFPGQGIVLFGDKTMLSRPSAFDRINVRRLFIVLEKAIATSAKFTLFEFNDEFTRASFVNLVTPFLRDVQGRRGIYDFAVICDETNNTGEVVDRNEFVGDIYIKPAKSINFIQLNFVAVRTGVEFSEVIGNF